MSVLYNESENLNMYHDMVFHPVSFHSLKTPIMTYQNSYLCCQVHCCSLSGVYTSVFYHWQICRVALTWIFCLLLPTEKEHLLVKATHVRPCCVVPDKDFLGGLLSRMGDFCDRGNPGLKKIVYFPMAWLVFKGIIAFLKCTSATSKKWVTSDVTATDSWKYKEKMPLSQCHGLIGSLQLSPV